MLHKLFSWLVPLSAQIAYPSSWSSLTWLGLEQRDTIFWGVFFALIFYGITLMIIGRLNYQEAVVYALILCSPPVMLLVERGNVDIVIYSWLGVGLMMIKNSREHLTYAISNYT